MRAGIVTAVFLVSLVASGAHGQVSVAEASSEEVVLQTDLKVGYGSLHDSLAKSVREALEQRFEGVEHCEKTGQKDDPRAPERRYRCGEIPFGDVHNKDWKSITEFRIDGQSTKSDGVSISTEPVRIAVWMGRPQYQGRMEISDLDTLERRDVLTNKRFGRDLYVRYSPETVKVGTADVAALNMHFCTAVPGTYWTIPEFKVQGRGKKKVWFFSISSGFTVSVDPGKLMYRYAKACGHVQTRMNPATLAPEVRVVSLDNPQLVDAKHDGLKVDVKVHNWLVNLVVKWFIGQEKVNRMVRDAIQKKIDAVVTEKDMQTGRWLEKLEDEYMGRKDLKKSLAQAFEKAVNSELAHMNYADPKRYKEELRKLCDQMDAGIPQLKGIFRDECRRLVNAADLEIRPFTRRADEAALGCYSHMASLFSTREKVGDEARKKWWYHRCTQAVNVRLKIRGKAAPLLACVSRVQGVITSRLPLEQRLKVLAQCSNEALALLKTEDRLAPVLAAIEDVLARVKDGLPSGGVDLIPGQWPMKDFAILRGSPLQVGLQFLREADPRIFELPRELSLNADLPLPQGEYSLNLWGAVPSELREASDRIGVIEVWDTSRNERLATQALWTDLLAAGPAELKFNVSNGAKVQFRFQWDRTTDVRLHKLRLKQIP